MTTYCESGIELFSTQPINTISNIAILISAFFAYRLIRSRRIKNKTIQALPITLVVLGISSIFWHAMPNSFTGYADTFSIVIFASLLFFFLLKKILKKKNLVWGMLFTLILVEAPFISNILPSQNGFIPYFILLVFGFFISIGIAMKYKSLLRKLVIVISLFVLAFSFRTIDLTICPIFFVGTHFMWHILNSFVFYLLVDLTVEIEKVESKHHTTT